MTSCFSIRVNSQWRLVLRFETGDDGRVVVVIQLVDYPLRDLFGVDDLDQAPTFAVAARDRADDTPLTPLQTVWLACAFRMARAAPRSAAADKSVAEVGSELTRVISGLI